MKPFSYYSTNAVIYPNRNDYTTILVYSGGKVIWEGPATKLKDAASTFPVNHVMEKVVDEDSFRNALAAYNKEAARLEAEFRRDLFEFHGVTDNPKADLCYSIAYDKGHADGFCGVASYFSDLVQLIK